MWHPFREMRRRQRALREQAALLLCPECMHEGERVSGKQCRCPECGHEWQQGYVTQSPWWSADFGAGG